ncbi:MAG: 8-amino-7-oxononanoate synthase, partial [Verrucomicrobiota bacterium]
RLICGSLAPHHELEEALAEFKKTQAALVFSSGYASALGTICALVGKEDIVILDKLGHASLIDAARLSGAKLRVFAHNDLDDLESILKWAASKPTEHTWLAGKRPRVLIVTESAFSMDGDCAPLRELVGLKEKYGAWLMIDEAHTTGICGTKGCGYAEECSVGDQIEIQMGTLGKALGASGGYICGSRVLIDYLINRARSFVFSTAPVPASAAAALAAFRFVQSTAGEERRDSLWQRVESAKSFCNPGERRGCSAILPILIGDENAALQAAQFFREQNIFIPAIRYPTVAKGQARLRLTLTASHTNDDLAQLRDVFLKLKLKLGNSDAPHEQARPT